MTDPDANNNAKLLGSPSCSRHILFEEGSAASSIASNRQGKRERDEKQKMVSIPPFVEGGNNQEHRPTLPSDQPNDRLFADRLRKRERKEIAH